MTDGTHYRTCPLCEATCGVCHRNRVRRGAGVSAAIVEDVFSRGYMCPKGSSLKGLHEDPDRTPPPLDPAPRGTRWRPTGTPPSRSSRNGSDRSSSNTARTQSACIPATRGRTTTRRSCTLPLLYGAIGRNRFAAASVDQRPARSCRAYFGTRTAFPVPDLDRTELLVLIGSDPFESNGSLATAPDWPGRLDAIRAARRHGYRRRSATVEDCGRRRRAPVDRPRHPTPRCWPASPTSCSPTVSLPRCGGPTTSTASTTVGRALAPFTPEAVGAHVRHRRRIGSVGSPTSWPIAQRRRPRTARHVPGKISPRSVELADRRRQHAPPATSTSRAAPCSAKPAALGLNTSGQPGVGAGTDYDTFRSRVRGLPGAFGQLPAAAIDRGDRNPGRRADPGHDHHRRQPGAVHPRTVLASRGALDSLEFMVSVDRLPERDHPSRRCDPAGPTPLQRSHYDVAFYQFSSATSPTTRRRSCPAATDSRTSGRPCSRLAGPSCQGRRRRRSTSADGRRDGVAAGADGRDRR